MSYKCICLLGLFELQSILKQVVINLISVAQSFSGEKEGKSEPIQPHLGTSPALLPPLPQNVHHEPDYLRLPPAINNHGLKKKRCHHHQERAKNSKDTQFFLSQLLKISSCAGTLTVPVLDSAL